MAHTAGVWKGRRLNNLLNHNIQPATARSMFARRNTPEAGKLYGVVPRTGMTLTEHLPIGKMNPPPQPSAAALAAAARRQAETQPHSAGTGHAAAADGAFDAAISSLEDPHLDAGNAAREGSGGDMLLDESDDSDVEL